MPALFLLAAIILTFAPRGMLAQAGDGRGVTPPERAALHPPAKSQQEREDFNAAYAIAGANAGEMAAYNFAAKYPDSELRQYLYSKAMRAYELENNPAGTLAMAQKVLALNPHHAVALVLTATVLADGLGAEDADKAKKWMRSARPQITRLTA